MGPHPILIAPSILAADLDRLQEEIDSVEPYSDWLHIDVMDGEYVDPVHFRCPDALDGINIALPRNYHLMIAHPEDEIDGFIAASAANITFHSEAVPDPEARKALIERIRAAGVGAGIAIEPDTPLSEVEDCLRSIDLLLVMSVKTGYSGQAFREEVLEKVRAARESHPDLMIQVDGGVDERTAKICREAGANNLVSASFIFGSADRQKAIDSLRGL